MITENSINEVKNRVDILEIISETLKLKKVGSDHVGICPFHNEKSPSFTVSPQKGIYKCFGCGVSGDGIKFIQETKKLSFLEAIKLLGDRYGITLEDSAKNTPRIKPVSQNLPLTISQYEYFAKRSIETRTLEHFKVTNANEWMPKAKAAVNAICFNYFRNEELINIKYRAHNKDFKLAKDAELIFYNLDSVKGKEYIVIVEGEIDCLSVHQSGWTSVISVPNGASAGNSRLDYLDNCHDIFDDKKYVIIATDNDAPGIALREELARRIGYEKCRKVIYPEGCKDANDVLCKLGAAALQEVIDTAVDFPVEGIITMSDVFGDAWNYYHNGYPEGVRAGITEFDDYVSFMPGQFTTITGVPGCFTKDQLVHTERGVRRISEIKVGEKVLSYNHEEKKNEYRTVTKTFIHETHTDKLYRIKLKDGTTIEVTENHLFFNGTEYVKIKDYLVSLSNEKMGKDT